MRANETNLDINRASNFFNVPIDEINAMYQKKSLDAELLLKWSKLLEYDFFRIYSQHLIFYAPPTLKTDKNIESKLPVFRKNIYTKEIIEFILELIENKTKTKNEIIEQYHIPKTTLYKWLSKNKK